MPMSWAVAVAVVVYLLCALHGLAHLEAADHFVAEQVAIGAIAQAGRGMAVTLLAQLTMVAKGWTPLAQAAFTAGLAVLFVGTYLATLAERDHDLVIRPY